MIDLTQVQTVLGLASTAVGLTGQAAATVDSVKKALSGGKGADSGKAVELLNSLASQLTTVNIMNVELSGQLRTLSKELEKDNRFEERLARYQLVDSGYGDLLYLLRGEAAKDEPEHYVCPVCIEKESRFHYVTGAKDGSGKLCQGCSKFYQFRPSAPLAPRRNLGFGG